MLCQSLCIAPGALASTFLARGCNRVFMRSLGTQFIKQIPLLFGHVSGQDLFSWA